MATGDKADLHQGKTADYISDFVIQYGCFNKSMVIHKLDLPGIFALEQHGLTPIVPLHPDFNSLSMSGIFEPGMVLRMENLFEQARLSVSQTGTQVLITETSAGRLDSLPGAIILSVCSSINKYCFAVNSAPVLTNITKGSDHET